MSHLKSVHPNLLTLFDPRFSGSKSVKEYSILLVYLHERVFIDLSLITIVNTSSDGFEVRSAVTGLNLTIYGTFH